MKTKTSRGAETRRRILDAAAKLMQKGGVNGTSVDDVLRASGTGKSQFYHYFASKDALVGELIGYYLAALPAASDEALSQLSTTSGIEAWLDRLVTDHESGIYDAGCPIGSLASELAAQNEMLRIELDGIFATWEQRLADGLSQMRAAGTLRSEAEPRAVACFFVGAVEGALLLAKTARSIAPLKSAVDQLKLHLEHLTLGATQVAAAEQEQPRAGATANPQPAVAKPGPAPRRMPPPKRLTPRFCP